VRRVLFLCAFFLFNGNSQAGIAWAVYLLLACILLQFLVRPYATKFENAMELLSLGLLLSNLAVSVGFRREVIEDGEGVKAMTLAVDGCFVTLLVLLMIKRTLQVGRKCVKNIFQSKHGIDEEDEMQSSLHELLDVRSSDDE
jgi:hypothetical protein